jgi:circadian clock protein KaiC
MRLLYASPVELQIDSIVVEIFEAIGTGAIRRLVIDAVGDLEAAASDSQRLHDYLYSLIQHFAVRGVTSMITMEAGENLTTSQPIHDQRFSYMSDNLLHLASRAHEPRQRTIRIVKMRGSAHDHGIRDFTIGDRGARVT